MTPLITGERGTYSSSAATAAAAAAAAEAIIISLLLLLLLPSDACSSLERIPQRIEVRESSESRDVDVRGKDEADEGSEANVEKRA